MTTELRLPKQIKRVTLLQASPPSAVGGAPVLVYRAKKRRRKGSRELKGLEGLTRRNVEATHAFAKTYLERHGRSNRSKKDGWIRDLGRNLFKANRRAGKKLKIIKLFQW